MVGRDTPEPIRSGRPCKTSHGAGCGQRTENPPALAVGSVKNACLSDFRIVNPTLRTFSAAEARIAQYAILFDLTRVAPPRTRTPNLSAEDMLRTYELAASGSLMPVGDNTWSKKSAFASVPPSKVIEAQFVNVN